MNLENHSPYKINMTYKLSLDLTDFILEYYPPLRFAIGWLLDKAEQGVYSYVNKENCEELVEYRLVSADDDPVVKEAEQVALDAWRVLGCRDAGRIDLRCDPAGRPQFIEVNPLAGIHPEHSDLPIICTKVGISYQSLIDGIVRSATRRVKC